MQQQEVFHLHIQGAQAGAPDLPIFSNAMSIMNLFINNISECITTEASQLAPYHKHSIMSREIQFSMYLLLPNLYLPSTLWLQSRVNMGPFTST